MCFEIRGWISNDINIYIYVCIRIYYIIHGGFILYVRDRNGEILCDDIQPFFQ